LIIYTPLLLSNHFPSSPLFFLQYWWFCYVIFTQAWMYFDHIHSSITLAGLPSNAPAFTFIPHHNMHTHTLHLFIHPSIHGHGGRLHSLASVNSAAWTWVCKSVCWMLTCIPSAICPGVGWLDHMVVLLSVFWGMSILISIVAALIYISPPSPHILTRILVYFLNDCYSDWG
jgi:hypothetical protein